MCNDLRSRAIAIVDRLSAVQGNGLAVKKIREDDVQDGRAEASAGQSSSRADSGNV